MLGGGPGSGYTPTVFSFTLQPNQQGFSVSVVPTAGGTVTGGIAYIRPTNVVTTYHT